MNHSLLSSSSTSDPSEDDDIPLEEKKNRCIPSKKKNRKKSSSSISFFQEDAWNVIAKGKSKRIDGSRSLSSTDEKKKKGFPAPKVLRPLQELFASAVYYRTYRLKRRFQWYDLQSRRELPSR